jgi:hypothetical protein
MPRLSNDELDAIADATRDGRFSDLYLGELIKRTAEVAELPNTKLADYIEDADKRYVYYISETTDYASACILEAARRLRFFGDEVETGCTT